VGHANHINRFNRFASSAATFGLNFRPPDNPSGGRHWDCQVGRALALMMHLRNG
jgi:hypothetical protein